MKISLKIAITLIAFSLLIASFGYISLIQLNKIAEPLTTDIPQSITELVETSRLGGQTELLRYYDEALTESAVNYAFTQDKVWEERYKVLEPQLDQQIKIAIEDNEEKDKENLLRIYDASRAIAEMDNASIDLVNNGNQEEAIKLLQSDKYLEAKRIYEQSLTEYETRSGSEYIEALAASTDVLTTSMANTQKLISDSTETLTLYVLIYIAIAGGLSFFVFRTVANPVKNLRDAADKIATGNWNVKIEHKGDDEINDLARSFKSMVDAVKRSEELISAAERKYRELYESSPDLYSTINTNGVIIDCNKSYAERLGYTKEEIIGTEIFNYTSHIDAMKNALETWKQTGSVKSSEIWLKTKEGTTFPTLLSASNLYDENANLVGSNTILKDISGIYEARKAKESQELMELQLAELKKLDKSKNEFVSMMTHELKTPLAPIMGRCEMLKEADLLGNLNAAQLDSVNKIYQNARRLEKLIGDVLEAQKIEMGSIKFDKEDFDVTNFMTEIHRDYSQLMKEKQIKFVNVTEEKITLKSDKSRIRQVIDNLVLNAADFTPEKNGKIEIGAKSEDGNVVFHIKDNGVGIPEDKLDKIFVKFYQVDTSFTRKHPGTGLGLAVCKGIVEGLGGKIWFESQVGKGTSFFFSIPKEENN